MENIKHLLEQSKKIRDEFKKQLILSQEVVDTFQRLYNESLEDMEEKET